MLGFLLGIPAILGSIARVIATAFEIVAPLLRGVLEFIIEVIKILWAGAKHTLQSWAAVALVVALMGGTAGYYKAVDLLEDRQQASRLGECQAEVKRLSRGKLGPSRPTPQNDYGFNFDGIGKWFR